MQLEQMVISLLSNYPRFTGLLAFMLIIVLVGCDSDADRIRATNEASTTPEAAMTPISAEIRSTNIQDGDCINSTLPEGINIETVVIVPCSGTWQYRVLNSFQVADSERYPGEELFRQRAYERCDRHGSFLLFPLAEFWEAGDRTVNCLQDSFGLSISDPAKLDRLVSLHSLSSGECFRQAPETEDSQVELVNCSGDWEFRVVNTFTVPDSVRYPEIEFFDRLAYATCDRRFTRASPPSVDSWKVGNRRVICLQDGFGLAVTDPAKLERLVGPDSLSSGECFRQAPETEYTMVELASCSDDWELRVLDTFTVPDSDRYPETDVFDRLAHEKCDRRVTSTIFPTLDSWKIGDRGLVCLQDGFGLAVTDPAKLERLVSPDSLSSGECFRQAPETEDLQVELASCSGDWEFQVTNLFPVPQDSGYPGDDYFQLQAEQKCDAPWDYYVPPDVESWTWGDRIVICLRSFASATASPSDSAPMP